MPSHRYHPDPEIETDLYATVLYDNCDRCTQHAKQLYSLDTQNLRLLIHMLLEVDAGQGSYGSGAEQAACVRILRMATELGRVIGVSGIQLLHGLMRPGVGPTLAGAAALAGGHRPEEG